MEPTIVKPEEWRLYKDFSMKEMMCSYTGNCAVTHRLMFVLQEIRDGYGKPMIVTSGYRDPSHPIEVGKSKPGEHAIGRAADILCTGPDALKIIELALASGVKRLGINQKGSHASRFIHIGVATQAEGFPEGIWTYP